MQRSTKRKAKARGSPDPAVKTTQSSQLISLLIPVFNEEVLLDTLVTRLKPILNSLNLSWNVLFVDDGSTDDSLSKLKRIHACDKRFTTISFSRNFGKEAAIAAGFLYARGDAVILMDADLQHPPEAIPLFVPRWREGYKLVFGQRQLQTSKSPLRTFIPAYFTLCSNV